MPINTSSSGKLSSFVRKLAPNTAKKKLLLFVIIFGLLAGGYYAYRSFAARIWVEGKNNGVAVATMEVAANSGGYTSTTSKGEVWVMKGAETSFVTPRDFAIKRKACLYGVPLAHGTISMTVRPNVKTKNSSKQVTKATGAHHGDRREQVLVCVTPKFSGKGKLSVTVRGHVQLTKLVY